MDRGRSAQEDAPRVRDTAVELFKIALPTTLGPQAAPPAFQG